MALTFYLIDENGRRRSEVHCDDEKHSFRTVLPPLDDPTFCCLRFIDWYSTTIFNGVQMDALLDELARVRPDGPAEALEVFDQVEKLARRCKSEVHILLRFDGD